MLKEEESTHLSFPSVLSEQNKVVGQWSTVLPCGLQNPACSILTWSQKMDLEMVDEGGKPFPTPMFSCNK